MSESQRPTLGNCFLQPVPYTLRSQYTVTLLCQTLQSTLKHDTVIRRTWKIGCRPTTLHSKLRPNRCGDRHGYNWQPTGIRHRPK